MRLGAAAIVVAALAATSTRAEPLPVTVRDGAVWTMIVAYTQDRETDGKTSSVSTTTITKLSLANTADGRRLTVTPLSASPGPGTPKEVAEASHLDIPVIVEVDAKLSPSAIVNMAELRETFRAMLTRANAHLPPGAPPMRDNLTDASITAMATRDLARVAMAQGSDMDLGREVVFTDDAPNPLGGGPISIKGAVRLESLDRDTGRAVITWRQGYDPNALKPVVAAWMDQMLAKAPPANRAALRTTLAKMRLDRADACRYDIDIASGLVATADCTVSLLSEVGGRTNRRTDHWIITQSPPEPR